MLSVKYHPLSLLMNGTQTTPPWDVRLAERWARQAKEAANDPSRYERPPLREQVRSPYFWLAPVAIGVGILMDSTNTARDWSGAVVAIGIGGVLGAAQRDRRRRSRG
jgi:hypothetical protein